MQNQLRFVSLFASLMSVWIVFSVALYRTGFPTSPLMLSKAVGLCFFVIYLPFWLVKEAKFWWQNRSFLSFVVLFLLGVLGYLVRFFSVISFLSYPIAIVGILLFALSVINTAKNASWRGWVSVFLLSLVIASYFLAYSYSQNAFSAIYEAVTSYAPISKEILIDNLYHAAVAKMIQTYQVLTTGTEGVVSMDYNVVSHWLFAQLALFLGVSILDFYDLLNPILFFPFFVYTFLSLVVQLYEYFCTKNSLQPLANLFSTAFWIVFFCLFFPIPDSIYARGMLGYHFVQSPVYTPALAFLWSFASVCLAYYQNISQKFVFQWLIFPLLLFLIGYTHVATGVAVVSAAGYVFLRFGLLRNLQNWFWIIFQVAILFFTYWLTAETNFAGKARSYEGAFVWFHFFRQDGFVWWDFLLGLYLPLFLLMFLWNKYFNVSSFLTKKTLFLELLVVIALGGIAPNCVLALYGSTGMYFMSIQRLLAGAVLLAYLPFLAIFWSFWKKKYAPYLATTLVIGFALLFYMSFRNTHNNAWQTNLNVRKTIMQIPDFSWKANHFIEKLFSNDKDWAKAHKLFSREIEPKVAQNQYTKLTRAIAQLDSLPISEKKQSLLHIPFHKLRLAHFDSLTICMVTPFHFTSLSGIALLGGIPKAECRASAYGYGYLDYSLRDKVWKEGLTRNEIVQTAKARGFRFVYYLKPENYTFEKVVVE
jgi:hypothetical protein